MYENLANKLKVTYIHSILLINIILTKTSVHPVKCENIHGKDPEELHFSSKDDYQHLRLHVDPKLFVDKSLLIKEILSNTSGELIMITRPCQFGKTLNLKMLHSFLQTPSGLADQQLQRKLFLGGDVEIDGKTKTLDKLKIADYSEIIDQHLGTHTVLYFSFKDCRINTNETLLKPWGMKIYNLYRQYGCEKTFEEMFTGPGRLGYYNVAVEGLWELALILRYNLKKKVICLIDDYDFLAIDAYSKYGPESSEFRKIVECITQMFVIFTSRKIFRVPGIGDPIEKAIFVGVTPFPIFDRMLNQYTITDEKFSPYFGLTDDEVDDLVDAFPSHRPRKHHIKNYYKGYTIGDRIIYNTASVIECLKHNGSLRPRWNSEILRTIDQLPLNTTIIAELERFVNRRTHILVRIAKSSDYSIKSLEDFCTFLFHAGYLNCTELPYPSTSHNCSVLNPEIEHLLQNKITDWINVTFHYMNRTYHQHKLLENLAQFEIRNFKHRMEHLLRMCIVNRLYNETHHYYVDVLAGLITERIPHRRFYRDNSSIDIIFLLDSHQGRLGIIIAIEVSKKADLGTIASTSARALQQISNPTYESILKENPNVQYVFKLAVSYHRYSVSVRYRVEKRNDTSNGVHEFHEFVLTTVKPVKSKNIPNRFKSGNNVLAEDMFEIFLRRLPVNNVLFFDFIEKSLELSRNNVVTFMKYLKSKERAENVNQTIYRMRNAIIDPDLYICPHAVVLTNSIEIIGNFSTTYIFTTQTVVEVVHQLHQDLEVSTITNFIRAIFENVDKSIHL